MKTFEIDGVKYRISRKGNGDDSNYNEMALLFREGDKTPIMGFTCKGSTPAGELIEQFRTSVNRGFDHLIDEAIKDDDVFDKMNCLIGYLERWWKNPQSYPPVELRSVIDEAIEYLKSR